MEEKVIRKPIRVRGAIDKRQYIIIPSFAVMNERFYYGYTVIAIAFGWLCFRMKIQFWAKIVRWCDHGRTD